MTVPSDRAWRTVRPLAEDWTWQTLGTCRQLAPEVFFPEDRGRSGLRAREERAKLATGETHGVWGAMSARDRAKLLTSHGQ